jgi:adenine-specific DNA methylase
MKETMINQEDGMPLEEMNAFVGQWTNFFNGVQQVVAEIEQLRQRVAKQDETIMKLQEALEQQKKGDEWASRITKVPPL